MMRAIAYRIIVTVCRYLVMPLYTRITVIGLENVPREGPLIIASNHLNDGDPGVICTRLPRRVVFMAKAELFEYPVLKQFMDVFGFAVHRREADLKALRQAQETLRAGLALCMFPEGTRSGSHARLIEAWPGAALIALRAGAPILPIGITGSQRLALPKLFLRPFRRERIVMHIGEPFMLETPARLNAEAAREGIAVIMARIADLLPEEYRGYYGSKPAEPEALAATERANGD
jgi:1-acyl-sn-glycerol-3-phosphate acyltransferase